MTAKFTKLYYAQFSWINRYQWIVTDVIIINEKKRFYSKSLELER